MSNSSIIDSLNAAQQEAVTAAFGNNLVLAGAGSGKTLVLVRRIAWFLRECQASPYSVLAVTFTNKAANEMRGRLEYMLGPETRHMWVGTFHGLSHKLLRLHWEAALLPENFQVIDSDDQLHIIRRIFKNLSINEDRFEPKKAQHFINRKKDEGLRAHKVNAPPGIYDQVMIDVYREYEKICNEGGLVDFAELILRSYELIQNNAEILNHYRSRFLHFLVDEFQDTNTIQYLWLKELACQGQSVTIVGDDDQSIYGWRGAKVENIRRFEREFKDTCIIRLEQNYRSTETILAAANALISNNDSRLGKTLWTQGEKGDPITVYAAFNEEDEALFIVRQIRALVEKGQALREIGILYRSNAQSRLIEDALVRAGIPYVIYGGLRFFERAEIKDALAYLRLAANDQDNTAFERVVNVPPRGVGDKTFEKIKDVAASEKCSYWQGMKKALNENFISGKAAHGLLSFQDIIEGLKSKTSGELDSLVEAAIKESGLLRFYREQLGEKAQSRAENLEELLNATTDFEAENLAAAEETDETISALNAFLSYTALESGERQSSEENQGSSVQLMTLHSAKGLEFPIVFISGLEDGLFPHHFSRENPKSLEEERRLCYVGITRAMRHLYLSYAEKRRLFGRDEERQVSRFVGEIPSHLLQPLTRKVSVQHPFRVSPQGQSFGGGRSSGSSFNSYNSIFANNNSNAMNGGQSSIFGNKMDRYAADSEGFCLGQRVSHPKFGEGTVVDHEGNGERARVHIHFDKHGSKWLALAYAKLEPMH